MREPKASAATDEHAALEGKTRSWDEHPLPGEEIQCRCVAIPVFGGEKQLPGEVPEPTVPELPGPAPSDPVEEVLVRPPLPEPARRPQLPPARPEPASEPPRPAVSTIPTRRSPPARRTPTEVEQPRPPVGTEVPEVGADKPVFRPPRPKRPELPDDGQRDFEVTTESGEVLVVDRRVRTCLRDMRIDPRRLEERTRGAGYLVPTVLHDRERRALGIETKAKRHEREDARWLRSIFGGAPVLADFEKWDGYLSTIDRYFQATRGKSAVGSVLEKVKELKRLMRSKSEVETDDILIVHTDEQPSRALRNEMARLGARSRGRGESHPSYGHRYAFVYIIYQDRWAEVWRWDFEIQEYELTQSRQISRE